jgi:hypothetical protein
VSGERSFEVAVDGYMPEVFRAPTRSKAYYRAFLAFTEAWPCTFGEWVHRARIREVPHGA